MQSKLAERFRDKRPKTINSAPSAGIERGDQKARGLSQEGLADLAGLHRTFVGFVERAATHISSDNIEKIAAALDVGAGASLLPAHARRRPQRR